MCEFLSCNSWWLRCWATGLMSNRIWLGCVAASDTPKHKAAFAVIDSFRPCDAGRMPGCAPGGALTFFRQKKSPKKAHPTVCDPFAALRGNLRRGVCGVRRRTHFAAAQLRSDNRGESVNEAGAHLRASHPANTPPQAHTQGVGQPEQPKHPHGPSLRSAAWRQRFRVDCLARRIMREIWL